VCVVLKTSQGLILIDTGYAQFTDHIPKAMEQLGLSPTDVKYIFINHAHTDHTGAANTLKKLTGARIGMAEGDWQFQASRSYMNSQGIPRKFDPILRDNSRLSQHSACELNSGVGHRVTRIQPMSAIL
jgi:glyoxylase-like metal-dependent hydrolase (beta-lactamase superfamily II)